MNSPESPEQSVPETEARGSRRFRGMRRTWPFLILSGTVLAALVVTAVVRGFIVDLYTVQQVSMEPTLHHEERILVERSYPTEAGPERGDIVVFDGTGSFAPYEGQVSLPERLLQRVGHWVGLGSPPQTYVKRVLGAPGDTVACCDEQGRLTVEAQPLEEPYLHTSPSDGKPASELEFEVQVPDGRIWVMGDHREESVDSRSLLGAPGGGMINQDRIIGRATSVFWPWESRRDLEEAEDGHR